MLHNAKETWEILKKDVQTSLTLEASEVDSKVFNCNSGICVKNDITVYCEPLEKLQCVTKHSIDIQDRKIQV